MDKKKRKASFKTLLPLAGALIRRRLPQAVGLALALSFGAPAMAAGKGAVARVLAEHASYLATEALGYEHGEGVPRDQPYAARLYCEAARLGNAEAMYALGWMYANGRGVERNDAHAASLFAMAAEQGDEHAARMLRFTGADGAAAPACLSTPSSQIEQRWPVEALIARLPQKRQQVAQLLAGLAPEYGVLPQFALAIGLTESALDPGALSPKSAMGVMQLIPATAERFNVTRPYDPEQNIRGGLKYLRWLLAYFEGDIALAAAAYNAGEGAVERYRGVPPYRETQAYVERILRHVGHDRHPFDSSVVAPSRMLRKLRLASQEEHDT